MLLSYVLFMFVQPVILFFFVRSLFKIIYSKDNERLIKKCNHFLKCSSFLPFLTLTYYLLSLLHYEFVKPSRIISEEVTSFSIYDLYTAIPLISWFLVSIYYPLSFLNRKYLGLILYGINTYLYIVFIPLFFWVLLVFLFDRLHSTIGLRNRRWVSVKFLRP